MRGPVERLLVGWLLLVTVAAGCRQAQRPAAEAEAARPAALDSGSGNVDAAEEPPGPRHVATFNAGLARNYVPYVEERLPAIIAGLNELDADVVCLQEVWEERDIKAVIAGARKRFPYNTRVQSADSIFARDAREPSCGPTDLQALAECVGQQCATAADKTGCVMEQCGKHFLSLPSRCRTCLAANVSKLLPEIVETCTSKGVEMGYDGANGLLLLSRSKFHDANHIVLESFLMQRIVLHGKLTVGGEDINVFCTHLSTPIAEVEYAGRHTSWEAEQKEQVERTIKYVKELAEAEPAVLMGDFNLGPANAEWKVTAEFPDHFQLLLDAGFQSPYTQDHGHCTFCGIEALSAHGPGKLIDHVLFWNFSEKLLMADRVMESKIEVGEGLKVPLSDHYGVRIGFE